MPSKRDGKPKAAHRRREPPTTAPEPITPPVKADVEPPKPQDRTAQPSEQPHVAEPRWPIVLPIVISGLVLVAIVVQAYIYKKQWDAMENQLNDARVEFRASHRPWVSLINEPVPQVPAGYVPDGHTNIKVAFVLKNAGTAPAIGVVINPKLELRDKWPPEPGKLYPECEPESLAKLSRKGAYGDLIIPGLEMQPILKEVEWREGTQGKRVFLIGCIAYTEDENRGCLPYVMSFAGEYSGNGEGCDSDKPCFIFQGWGHVLNEPEKCPK